MWLLNGIQKPKSTLSYYYEVQGRHILASQSTSVDTLLYTYTCIPGHDCHTTCITGQAHYLHHGHLLHQ